MTDSKERVSVAMATWMGARFIEAQLQSFLRQTLRPDELVVRDDGSTDATLDVIRRFKGEADFLVKILPSGPRLGYAKNFGDILSEVTGDLIFLSDQDDVWFPEKIERIVEYFHLHPRIQLIINDLEITNSSLTRTGISKLNNVLSSGLRESNFITGCATTVRKSFLDVVVLPLPKCVKAHDWWLHFCAHSLGVRVILPEVLQLYRRHGDNASAAQVSVPKKLGRFEAVIGALLLSPKESHVQQLLMTQSLLERLTWLRCDQQCHLLRAIHISVATLENAVKGLQSREQALKGRVRVLEARWPNRICRAVVFWLSGGYKEFRGAKSLIRDALPSVQRS